MAAVMDHLFDAPQPWETESEAFEDSARVTVIAELRPGQKLTLVKLVAYGWSGGRSVPALRDQTAAAIAAARHTGWEGMQAEQRAYLDDFWDAADVHVDGDPEIQQAVRFACSRSCRPGPAPKAAPSRRRGSPVPAMTATLSGTAKASCCRCSPTPSRPRRPTP